MKYLLFISIFTSVSFAQVDSLSEALKYYPMEIGNYWEYKNHYWQFPFYNDSSAHSVEIIGDTILPNNKSYKILLQKNIPENSYSIKTFERVDSLTACVYRYSDDTLLINNEYLVDSLLAKPGDYISGSRTGYSSYNIGGLSTKCNAEYELTIFGMSTDLKEFFDQSFIPGITYALVKGLGFVGSNSCEISCGSSNLVYALIDGIEYGDRITKVEESELIQPPNEFILNQNFPNPFNPTTTINYIVPKQTKVKVIVFDALGHTVKTLVNEIKPRGIYSINFDANGLSSGIYYYQIITDDFIQTKKMVLLK